MTSTRKTYSQEYKIKAVEFYLQTGASIQSSDERGVLVQR
ncbi:MAG: transposase [Chitinophagales bacterium]|nr:transposase [Chitinophagales bacterium]HMX60334.1 transposase [Chitinophagales bacterium]HMX60336.1 transposase [Chitinophagales bacterium]HMY23889.1 transposase [Chitinophagales bacterium]HMY23891.1 transposase [Chitinophagales bacterium]